MTIRAKTTNRRREVPTVSRLGQRRQVVIPKGICDELGIRQGDFVEVTRRKDHVVIKPKKLVDPEDTLTPDEEKAVERGFRQLRRGEYVDWEALKSELGL
jgi:AbrB family looped-hinge helix DNA binding protein